jgi:hypothetical protein
MREIAVVIPAMRRPQNVAPLMRSLEASTDRATALEIPVHVHTGVRTTHLKHLWLDERIYDRLAPPDA